MPFSVSHDPADGRGTLELLAAGLTFDLSGLDGTPAPCPPIAHGFGLPSDYEPGADSVVALHVGAHLRGGMAILPVVRVMVAIGAALAQLPGVNAVAWHPARTAMAPEAFRRAIGAWLDGGAFPALSLTGLAIAADGTLRSEGLAFFTGQEIAIGIPGITPRQAARIAVRLIDALVGAERMTVAHPFTGPDGEPLIAEPSFDKRVITINLAG